MSESQEIKPCPFCGGEAIVDYNITQSVTIEWEDAHVTCLECESDGAYFQDDSRELPVRDVRKQAIDAWNKRV